MDRTKAIELLKIAVPQDESLDEDGLFIEAISMAIKALEGKDTNAPTNSALDHIHNVVRDDAYRRGYEQGKADAAPKWIPFTADTMPKEDGEYFVLYDDKYAEDYDTGSVGVADFYVDCEAFGYWQSYYDPVTLGYVDSDFIEIKVKKWMPIPKEE